MLLSPGHSQLFPAGAQLQAENLMPRPVRVVLARNAISITKQRIYSSTEEAIHSRPPNLAN